MRKKGQASRNIRQSGVQVEEGFFRERVLQRVRVDVRRLHHQFGLVSNGVVIQLLQASRLSREFIEAIKLHRCA